MLRILPTNIVNRIAAGEVIERPFSAIKELVENSIDAGADNISVHIRAGGKSYIRVTDNGCGMSRDDLALAIERHATSKLDEDDLFAIRTLGFRGEALPSIASVSRMLLSSRLRDADEAWALNIEGGNVGSVKPCASPREHGTTIEVRDLFYATPARLKFLRSDRAENGAIIDVINRLAMAYPHISFTLFDGERKRLDYSAYTAELSDSDKDDDSGKNKAFLYRLRQVMGSDFSDNAMVFEAEKEGMVLSGYAGLPTLNRATSTMQFLFVNGRPIKDRQMLGAIRAAYADFLARDRHPLVVLYLRIDPHAVDVNVHPQKTDVRFRDAARVRGLLVSGLRHALAEGGFRASATVANTALGYARSEGGAANRFAPGANYGGRALGAHGGGSSGHGHFGFRPAGATYTERPRAVFDRATGEVLSSESGDSAGGAGASGASLGADAAPQGMASHAAPASMPSHAAPASMSHAAPASMSHAAPASMSHAALPRGDTIGAESSHAGVSTDGLDGSYFLGAARAQLHENYIISQTADGIVIVDQHAAHERILYERMKSMLASGSVPGQGLLSPEIVDLGDEAAESLLKYSSDFATLGLVMESFGSGCVAVRETPSLLGVVDIGGLVRDLADEVMEYGSAFSLRERLNEVFSTMACHSSIRSGRRLLPEEMNALLREMETTPHAGQCNHGRPTYVELKLRDIEALFGRR